MDQLGQFGSIMISEIVSRVQQLETKAIVILGYDGAIIAFLLTLLRPTPYSGFCFVQFSAHRLLSRQARPFRRLMRSLPERVGHGRVSVTGFQKKPLAI